MKALITDCAGLTLSDDEKHFFAEAKPYGFILFQRNCESPAQIKALIAELHEVTGRAQLPILIDQEGGRVARLKPPHWRAAPSAAKLAALSAAEEAVYVNARLLAQELRELGITVDCAPVADIPSEGAHDVIGDRAYGREPQRVAQLAGASARGFLDGGVIPVIKHIPGHGRAGADSHLELPVVHASLEELRRVDFEPFRLLNHVPMAMTAHVLYPALDDKNMATVSPKIIRLIREEIGFDGLLMSDDVSMKAMQGTLRERAEAVLAAGCDVVLHCNGTLSERMEVASGCVAMTDAAQIRSERAFAAAASPKPLDVSAALARLGELVDTVAA